jgi:hypothetical protein
VLEPDERWIAGHTIPCAALIVREPLEEIGGNDLGRWVVSPCLCRLLLVEFYAKGG